MVSKNVSDMTSWNYLKPILRSLAGLVAALWPVQHLNHQSFAAGLDTVFEEDLNFLQLIRVAEDSKGELALGFDEGVVKQFSTLPERFVDKRLGVR